MSYLKLNHHTLNCNNIFKYIKKSQDEHRQFWSYYGLSKEDIKCLMDMEGDEIISPSSLDCYESRRCLLKRGAITIDDVIKDIEEYKIKLKERGITDVY